MRAWSFKRRNRTWRLTKDFICFGFERNVIKRQQIVILNHPKNNDVFFEGCAITDSKIENNK